MDRRGFVFGGASVAMLAGLPGCLPIFGLMLRGGALRAFAAGARVGGRASLHSLGRGIAVGNRASSIHTTSTVQPVGARVRVINQQRQTLAESISEPKGQSLVQGTRKVFFSRTTHYGSRHQDAYGRDVGKSVNQHAGRVDHYAPNNDSRRVGFDVVLRAGRLIRHFDDRENQIGETEIQMNGSDGEVQADQGANDFFDELAQLDLRCPETTRQREIYNRVNLQCRNGSDLACRQRAAERSKLRRLEEICR